MNPIRTYFCNTNMEVTITWFLVNECRDPLVLVTSLHRHNETNGTHSNHFYMTLIPCITYYRLYHSCRTGQSEEQTGINYPMDGV